MHFSSAAGRHWPRPAAAHLGVRAGGRPPRPAQRDHRRRPGWRAVV